MSECALYDCNISLAGGDDSTLLVIGVVLVLMGIYIFIKEI